jgi:hypothetical protein
MLICYESPALVKCMMWKVGTLKSKGTRPPSMGHTLATLHEQIAVAVRKHAREYCQHMMTVIGKSTQYA